LRVIGRLLGSRPDMPPESVAALPERDSDHDLTLSPLSEVNPDIDYDLPAALASSSGAVPQPDPATTEHPFQLSNSILGKLDVSQTLEAPVKSPSAEITPEACFPPSSHLLSPSDEPDAPEDLPPPVSGHTHAGQKTTIKLGEHQYLYLPFPAAADSHANAHTPPPAAAAAAPKVGGGGGHWRDTSMLAADALVDALQSGKATATTTTTPAAAAAAAGGQQHTATATTTASRGHWWKGLGRVVRWFFPAPLPSPSNDLTTSEWMRVHLCDR
ncbi:unnamed protein product, partial [Vitrella brassicaformis CCMP3155]